MRPCCSCCLSRSTRFICAWPSATRARETRKHPWTFLFASGLVLVAASFVIWGITEGSGQQGVYVPPHVEDGRVVPGHVDTGAPK